LPLKFFRICSDKTNMRRFKYGKGGDSFSERESIEESWIVKQTLGEKAKKKNLRRRNTL